MRPDMYKVIVERPRHWKASDAQADRLRNDFDGPMQLGMRAGHGKPWLNENLAPLRRYLRAQVGRPWNKVYSEISAGIDRRNTVQQHIYEHIADFIAIDVTSAAFAQRVRRCYQELYVDPRTGLIRVNKEHRAWRREQIERREQEQVQLVARRRILNDRTVLMRLDDLWFEVTLAELPAPRAVQIEGRSKVVLERRYDIVLRRPINRNEDASDRGRVYGSSDLYAVSKRQLSKRELKAHGLRSTTGPPTEQRGAQDHS